MVSNTTYRCTRCNRDLPADQFYYAKDGSGRRYSGCIPCRTAAYHKAIRTATPEVMERRREAGRLAARRWRATPHGRAKSRENGRRYCTQNAIQKKAKDCVFRALRSGALVRGPCQVCGSTVGVQAHHHDYSKPLDVAWLCSKDHAPITLGGKAVSA